MFAISSSKRSRLTRRASAAIAGLVLAFAMQAHATIMPGDHFIFDWTDTAGPGTGLTGSIDLTVGAALTAPFFAIASFDVTQNGSFCSACTPLTEDLSGAQFDSATFGLLGHITGTFIGSGGNNTHSFDLALTDIAGAIGTWQFTDTKEIVPPVVVVDSGTYIPLVPSVDEPAEMLLLAIGFVALAASRRRKPN